MSKVVERRFKYLNNLCRNFAVIIITLNIGGKVLSDMNYDLDILRNKRFQAFCKYPFRYITNRGNTIILKSGGSE